MSCFSHPSCPVWFPRISHADTKKLFPSRFAPKQSLSSALRCVRQQFIGFLRFSDENTFDPSMFQLCIVRIVISVWVNFFELHDVAVVILASLVYSKLFVHRSFVDLLWQILLLWLQHAAVAWEIWKITFTRRCRLVDRLSEWFLLFQIGLCHSKNGFRLLCLRFQIVFLWFQMLKPPPGWCVHGQTSV